jgi:hypothetical protein
MVPSMKALAAASYCAFPSVVLPPAAAIEAVR